MVAGWLHPRSQVPVVAIVLQGLAAALIAQSGTYEQINKYVVPIDVIFFGLAGVALLVFRARARRNHTEEAEGKLVRVPWHPFTTAVFVAACWALALATVIQSPRDAGIGVGILGIGVIVYQFWRVPRSSVAAPRD